MLDHYAASGVGVEHYAEDIEKQPKQYGWRDGTDYVPHDAKVKEWGTGKTRVETMQQLGLSPMLVPMATFQDGINACEGRCRCACFTRGPRRPASLRLNNTGASGTMRKSFQAE